MSEKKIYFASDLHLGVPDKESSRQREKHFVQWLDKVGPDAKEIYLLGDVFDFWFEYEKAVPKGYVRIQGKLAELSDAGIPVHYFVGNHDMWLRNYFQDELGLHLYYHPEEKEFFGRKFFLAHGDGLGPGDQGYKFLKRVFRSPFLQWAFGKVHPNTGIGIAEYFSKRSREGNAHLDKVDHGDNEFLLLFSKEYSEKRPDVSYFVFGHRHFPVKREFSPGKFYINLGDWIGHYSYMEADESGVRLLRFVPGDARTFLLHP